MWSVVLKSASAYVQFFHRYSNVTADLRRDNRSGIEHARSVQRTGIIIKMAKSNDTVCYAGPQNERLGSMERDIVNLFNTMVECLVVDTTQNSRASQSTMAEEEEENQQQKQKDKKNEQDSKDKDNKDNKDNSSNSNGTSNNTNNSNNTNTNSSSNVNNDTFENNTKEKEMSSTYLRSSAPSILFPRPSYFLMKTKRLPEELIPLSKTLINANSTLEHIDVIVLRHSLETIIDSNCKEARRMLELYEDISVLLIDPKERSEVEEMGKKGFGSNGSTPTMLDFQERINKYLKLVQIINDEYLTVIPCGCFMIQCDELNVSLIKSACNLSKKLLKTLVDNTISRNMKLHKRFDLIRGQSERVPSTSDELEELEMYFEATLARGGEVDVLKQNGLDLIKQTKFLMINSKDVTTGGCGFMMIESYLSPTGRTLDWLSRTDGLIVAGKKKLSWERDRLESALKKSREGFMKGLDLLLNKIEEYKLMVDGEFYVFVVAVV